MNRDIIINGILLALIGGVAYLLFSFEPAELRPPRLASSPTDANGSSIESTYVATPNRPPQALEFVKNRPFKDIALIPPTPTPPPPTPIPPPPLQAVMAQYKLVMLDPPDTATMTDPAQAMFEWKVKQTREITFNNQLIKVTLEKIDPDDFSVHFSSAGQAPHVMKFF